MSDKHSSKTLTVGIACTEGKSAEAQQKLYEQIIAHTNEAILILDPQGLILEQNPAHRALTGYSDEELRGKRPVQLLGEGAFPQIMQELSRTGSYQTEASVRTRAGVLVTVDLSLVTVCDDAGKVLCHVALKRDITERKRAEEAIRESQDRFRQAAKNIQEVFYISDPELTQIIFISPAYEKVWGRTCKSLYENPRSFLDAIHPDDRERATAAAEKQEPAEYRIIQPDGSLRWIWDRAFPVRDEKGRIYRFVGIAEDITDRKQVEEALRRSEARLSEAQRVGRLGSWEWDIVKNEIALSDEMCNILGVPQQSASWNFETALGFVHPDDRESVNKSMREALHEEKPYNLDTRISRPDGSERIVHSQGEITFDDTGRPIRMVGTGVDITDRKRGEVVRQRLLSIMEATSDFVSTADVHGRVHYVNTAGRKLTGIVEKKDTTQMELPDFHPVWALRAIVDEYIPHASRHGFWRGETALLGPGGEEIPVSAVIMAHKTPAGEVSFLSTIMRDITERKQAEQALRFTQFVVDRVGDAAFWIKPDGGFSYVNDAACRLHGYSREELLSMKVFDLSPGYRVEVWSARWEEMKQHGSSTFEAIHRRKDGRVFPVEVTINFVELEGREYGCAFARDTTERRHVEEALHEERRRIARELHDGVGQSLTALSMNLAAVVGEAAKLHPRGRKAISESEALAEDCLRKIRTLSHLLHTPELDGMGLAGALRGYVHGFSSRSGIRVTFKMPRNFPRLPQEVETTLFRVVQEALTNIHRHSGSHTAALQLTRGASGVGLEVRDKGRGISSKIRKLSRDRIANSGVGLPGMQERMQQLGGKLEIHSSIRGTTVKGWLPFPERDR